MCYIFKYIIMNMLNSTVGRFLYMISFFIIGEINAHRLEMIMAFVDNSRYFTGDVTVEFTDGTQTTFHIYQGTVAYFFTADRNIPFIRAIKMSTAHEWHARQIVLKNQNSKELFHCTCRGSSIIQRHAPFMPWRLYAILLLVYPCTPTELRSTTVDTTSTNKPSTSSVDTASTSIPSTITIDKASTDKQSTPSVNTASTDNLCTTTVNTASTDKPSTTAVDMMSTDKPSTTTVNTASTDKPSTTVVDMISKDTAHTDQSDYTTNDMPSECNRNMNNAKMTEDELLEVVEKLKKELKVDKSKLSSTKRRLTSAADQRSSAKSIGYVGAFVLFSVFGVIVASDIPMLFRHFKMFLHNVNIF